MSSGPIFSGIAASIITPVLIGWMINSTREVRAGRDGWKRLRPSAGIYATIMGAALFSLGAFYVYFFVGSMRSDAERQMMWCLLIAFTFGLGAIALTYQAFWRSLSWQGRMIRLTTPTGFERVARIDDIESIEYSHFKSVFEIRFRLGWKVDASPYMHGTRQMLEHIDRLVPADSPAHQVWQDDED